MEKSASPQPKKRNLYISYIKGTAMLGIVLVHLINWSEIYIPFLVRIAKESLHSSLFLFVLTTGSVIIIAYQHRASLLKSSLRLMYRGGQLLLFYYLYNVIKLLIFDFSTQPFYSQFIDIGTLTISNIFTFRSFAVPITILPTYSFLLALSPLLLLLHRKFKYKKTVIATSIVALFTLNYLTAFPLLGSPITEFLYANGYSIISVMLWLLPFLIGIFLAQIGFEKHRFTILLSSVALTLISTAFLFMNNESLFPSDYQFPLRPHLIAFSLFIFSLLLYAFRSLEAKKNKYTKKTLAIIRFIGDNTLHVYIYHWIVIDLTIWAFPTNLWLIWFTVPIFLMLYLFAKRKKLAEYRAHQENAVQDMGVEIS